MNGCVGGLWGRKPQGCSGTGVCGGTGCCRHRWRWWEGEKLPAEVRRRVIRRAPTRRTRQVSVRPQRVPFRFRSRPGPGNRDLAEQEKGEE